MSTWCRQHPDEDRGEIATIFYAVSRREAGEEEFKVITDDQYGKTLARDRGLGLVTTADIAVEMVQADVLSHADGKRVWRQCVSRARWNDFDLVLAEKGTPT